MKTLVQDWRHSCPAANLMFNHIPMVLLNPHLFTGEVTEGHSTHCHVLEISLSLLCDIEHYPGRHLEWTEQAHLPVPQIFLYTIVF